MKFSHIYIVFLSCACVKATNLYDYGNGFDKVFNKSSPGMFGGPFQPKYIEWDLPKPVMIFGDETGNGTMQKKIRIYESGVITFGTSNLPLCPSSDATFSDPFIAPYWVQVDITRGGNIFYRQEDSSSITSKKTNYTAILEEINRGNNVKESENENDIRVEELTSVIFITWENMNPPFNFFSFGNHKNTFQLVIAATPTRQFALFLYKRLDYYIFHSFQYYCQQAAVAGLNFPQKNYNFQLSNFFYLAPYNLLLHSNIQPYTKLRRYLALLRKVVMQPAPPRINCTGSVEDSDPYCLHGISPSFCALHSPGIYPHPSKCNNFVLCGPDGNLNVESCGPGVNFNPAIHGCDWRGYYKCNDVTGLNMILANAAAPIRTLISIRFLINQNTYEAFHNNTCFGIPEWGNAVDISSCEHYLMCSNTRTYRLPCPLSWNGEKLYYNREKNYCDYKRNVDCNDGKRPRGPTTPFFVPTTSSTTTRRRITTTTIHPPTACRNVISGNNADPTSCEHYFSCRNNKVLHRFQCPLSGFNNERLFYNREKDYCDYQKNVICDDGERPGTTTGASPTKLPPTTTEYITEWSTWSPREWGEWTVVPQ